MIGTKFIYSELEKSTIGEDSVERLIVKHRVCYERWKDYEMVKDVRIHSGYSLCLYGANVRHTGDFGLAHPVPGCAVCRATYSDLVRIARAVLPTDARESQYKIEPFDFAFHIAPQSRRRREEIVATIHISPKAAADLPSSECQYSCLTEMCRKLKEFGVLEGRVNDAFEKEH